MVGASAAPDIESPAALDLPVVKLVCLAAPVCMPFSCLVYQIDVFAGKRPPANFSHQQELLSPLCQWIAMRTIVGPEL